MEEAWSGQMTHLEPSGAGGVNSTQGPRFPQQDAPLTPRPWPHREQSVFNGPEFTPTPHPPTPTHWVSPLFNSKQIKTRVGMWQGLHTPVLWDDHPRRDAAPWFRMRNLRLREVK